MLNIVAPNVVLQAFMIIIPIANYDLFDDLPWNPSDIINEAVKEGA